jgi:NADH-quinone oxidoreductase subunit A
MQISIIPILLFGVVAMAVAGAIVGVGYLFNPRRRSRVKEMPYESGMDPIHDTHRRFDIRFHLLAIAFLVFDVELLFLYPWAVAGHQDPVPVKTEIAASAAIEQPVSMTSFDAAVDAGWIESRGIIFAGVMFFIVLVALGFIYDWRKGIFHWR